MAMAHAFHSLYSRHLSITFVSSRLVLFYSNHIYSENVIHGRVRYRHTIKCADANVYDSTYEHVQCLMCLLAKVIAKYSRRRKNENF